MEELLRPGSEGDTPPPPRRDRLALSLSLFLYLSLFLHLYLSQLPTPSRARCRFTKILTGLRHWELGCRGYGPVASAPCSPSRSPAAAPLLEHVYFQRPVSSEYGTHRTVQSAFESWLSDISRKCRFKSFPPRPPADKVSTLSTLHGYLAQKNPPPRRTQQ